MKLCIKIIWLSLIIPILLFAQHWTPDNRITQTNLQSLTSLNNTRCVAVAQESIIHIVWMEERARDGFVIFLSTLYGLWRNLVRPISII